MNATKNQLLDLFDWWLDALRVAVGRAPSAKSSAMNSEVSLFIRADGIGIVPRSLEPAPVLLPRDADGQKIFSAISLRAEQVDVRIHHSLVLTRHLATQRLPIRQAREMAELDLIASTPVDLTQIHIVFSARHGAECYYHVIKRHILTPALDAIRLSGASIGVISIATEYGDEVADRLSRREISPPTPKDRLKKLICRAVLAAFLVVFAATYAHALWRYDAAQSELDEQIAAAQVQAKLARSQIEKRQAELDQAATIRDQKHNSPSLVRTWAELTRVLPDNAWLTDLSAKGDELTINGFAGSAANLIGPLEASPLFSCPDFTAPVVKVPGQEGERFAIKAKVVRP